MDILMTTPKSRGIETLVTTKAYDSVLVSTCYVGDASMHEYETLVFRYSMMHGKIEDLDEFDGDTYNTVWESQKGHERMVNKWRNETRDISTIKHRYDY